MTLSLFLESDELLLNIVKIIFLKLTGMKKNKLNNVEIKYRITTLYIMK